MKPAPDDPVAAQLAAAMAVIRHAVPSAETLGVYLHGSAVAGGLRPDSDLDLFVVTRRRLTDAEKRSLVDGLLPISGRATRPPRWRPLEVTVVAQDELRPWRYPPQMQLQYGEWLRSRFLAGELGPASVSPDLAILVEVVRQSGRPLSGPPPAELLDPVPRPDLMRAMTDELPTLLDELQDDTRNVILTLARIWATIATGGFLSKDDAAAWAIERLPAEVRAPLSQSRELYLGGGYGTWDDQEAVRATAAAIRREIELLVDDLDREEVTS